MTITYTLLTGHDITYTLLTGQDNHLYVTYRSWQSLTRYLQVITVTNTLLTGHGNHLHVTYRS